jgi:hypothetical protein
VFKHPRQSVSLPAAGSVRGALAGERLVSELPVGPAHPGGDGGGIAGRNLSGRCTPILGLTASQAAALSSPLAASLTATLAAPLAASLAACLDRVDCRAVVLLLGGVYCCHGPRLPVAVEDKQPVCSGRQLPDVGQVIHL